MDYDHKVSSSGVNIVRGGSRGGGGGGGGYKAPFLKNNLAHA